MKKNILISTLLSGVFLASTFAVEPEFTGVETESSNSGSSNVTATKDSRTKKDFEYVRTGISDRAIKKSFIRFTSSSRNAGLPLIFLKKFDRLSLENLKKYLSDSNGFWQRLEGVGADKETLDKKVRELMDEQGITKKYDALLKRLHDIEDGINSTGDKSETTDASLKKIKSILEKEFTALMSDFRLSLDDIIKSMSNDIFGRDSDDWEQIADQVISDLDRKEFLLKKYYPKKYRSLRKITFVNENNKKQQLNIYQELKNRIRFLRSFSKSAKKDANRYVVAYLLSWHMTRKNVDIALLGDLSEKKKAVVVTPEVDTTQKEDETNQKEDQAKITKEEIVTLTRHYKEVAELFNSTVSFSLSPDSNEKVEARLHSSLTKINSLYKLKEVDKAQKSLSNIQKSLLNKIEANASLKESTDYAKIKSQMARLDAEMKLLTRNQELRETKRKSLNEALVKIGITKDVADLNSKKEIEAFMLALTKVKITKEKKAILAKELTIFTQLNIAVLVSLERSSKQYFEAKKQLGEYQEVKEKDSLSIVKWIKLYDRNHKSNTEYKSYGALIQKLLATVQKSYKGRLESLNTPFLGDAQRSCRKYFPKTSLEKMQFSMDSTISQTASFVQSDVFNLDQKRIICYADYEFSLRKNWNESKNNFLLETISKEKQTLHFNVKNIEIQDSFDDVNLSFENDASSSIFEGLLKVLGDSREISNVKLNEYLKRMANEVLPKGYQLVPSYIEANMVERKLKLGKQITDDDEEMSYFFPKDGSNFYSGLWLGITIGAKNLQSRRRNTNSLKGLPAINELEEELSRYMGDASKEFLQRRALERLKSSKYPLLNAGRQKDFLDLYEVSKLSKLSGIVPSVSLVENQTQIIGYGYGNESAPGVTRYMHSQSPFFTLNNWIKGNTYWGSVQNLSYSLNSNKGRIFQLFIPVSKLEQKSGGDEDIYREKSQKSWTKEEITKIFSETINKSLIKLDMKTRYVDSIEFSDVLYLDGKPVLDATGLEYNDKKVPGVKINN
ncbi:MAG: hypothetical protein COB02_08595 [Candidatus Cloacimonadota bacterium]|nr:MAG: hypothetical protein COB02_08595 [Candidatus Cloacimonadota bacterium]